MKRGFFNTPASKDDKKKGGDGSEAKNDSSNDSSKDNGVEEAMAKFLANAVAEAGGKGNPSAKALSQKSDVAAPAARIEREESDSDGSGSDPEQGAKALPGGGGGKKGGLQFGGPTSGLFASAKKAGGLVINEHWLTDPAKRSSVMRAVRKRINRPGNRANADAVRAKWSRLLDARPELYRYWKDLVDLGKHKDLLKLELHLLEKELLATDQKDVMLAVMAQFVAGAPACCDEILDGFEVIPGKTPSIWWRDGDRMISMTLMRLHKLMITRNDDHHLDIVDQWDKDSEDQDILLAWEERARSWNMDEHVLEKAKEWKLRSVEKDPVTATELLLRDFVGYVYVVQANRLIAYHRAAMLEEEMLEEERSKERQKQKKAAKKQQRKGKSKQDNGTVSTTNPEDPSAAVEAKEEGEDDDDDLEDTAGGHKEEEWYSFARARRQVLAERIVRRQRHLTEMCKPKSKAPVIEEVEEEGMDEWQTFDQVLAEMKKEIGNYKCST